MSDSFFQLFFNRNRSCIIPGTPAVLYCRVPDCTFNGTVTYWYRHNPIYNRNIVTCVCACDCMYVCQILLGTRTRIKKNRKIIKSLHKNITYVTNCYFGIIKKLCTYVQLCKSKKRFVVPHVFLTDNSYNNVPESSKSAFLNLKLYILLKLNFRNMLVLI